MRTRTFLILISLTLISFMPKKSFAISFDFLCQPENISWEQIISPDVYSRNFTGSIEDFIENYQDRFGKCKVTKIKKIDNNLTEVSLSYKEAIVNVKIQLKDNLIDGLRLKKLEIKNDSFEKIEKDLETIRGQLSVCVKDGEQKTLFSYNADKVLALGSSFKLFVLRALLDGVNEGKFRWSDVITLDSQHISYPSGILQNWPIGTPITIKTLAILMISKSDNTATDILIDLIGRDKLEEYAPHNKPFLKTREMFQLKDNLPSVRKKYIKADEKEKRSILSSIAKKELKELLYDPDTPTDIDTLEWFASTEELASLIMSLKNEDILRVNPGILGDSKKWIYVGYKGGYEPGVMQFTQLLGSKKGKWYSISLTWNDASKLALDDHLQEIVLRLERLLK